MVRFSKMDATGKESDIRFIKQSDIKKCPHYIIAPEHYREDGSCKCDDPHEIVMKEWGYEWNETTKQWS